VVGAGAAAQAEERAGRTENRLALSPPELCALPQLPVGESRAALQLQGLESVGVPAHLPVGNQRCSAGGVVATKT
jgi:hypothetical protein